MEAFEKTFTDWYEGVYGYAFSMLTIEGAGILTDKDGEGYLLQILNKPFGDRSTLLFEISGKGTKSLERGFKALFDAIGFGQTNQDN